MRRFADTLPTLKETPPAAATPLLPAPGEDSGFDPAAVVRALAARRANAFPAADQMSEEAKHAIASEQRRGSTRQSSTAASDASTACSPPARREEDERPARSAAEVARARLATLAEERKRGGRAAASRAGVSGDGAQQPLPKTAQRQKGSEASSAIPSLDPPPEPEEDKAATAVAAALERAKAEKEQAIEAARAEERSAAETRLAEARAAWAAEQAAPIANGIAEAFETLHTRLSDAFARALAPIADSAVRERALRRFASVLDDLASESSEAPPVTVRGPADLVQAAAGMVGERPGVAFEAADTAELVVTLDDTRVETVIGAWADDLAKALGAPHDG